MYIHHANRKYCEVVRKNINNKTSGLVFPVHGKAMSSIQFIPKPTLE